MGSEENFFSNFLNNIYVEGVKISFCTPEQILKQMDKKVFTNLCSLSFVYLDLIIFWQIMLEN